MKRHLVRDVHSRANNCCEYCRLPRQFSDTPFQIDHVVPIAHGGASVLANLALSCFLDNNFKGTNLAGIDPKAKKVVRIFNPRQHNWNVHFRWQNAMILGRTAIGRATAAVLRLNLDFRVAHRLALMDEGVFPIA